MAENNQLSGNTKNSSTGTSSTDASSETIGKHENEIVPHKISNHDKLVQTMVMVDGEWINVNDTNDQANMKDDMNKVNKKVVEAQKGIVEAKSAADSAAKAAVSASVVNSDAITAQSAAISEAKSAISSATAAIQQTAANAASDAAKIRADVAQVQNEVNTAKAANSASVEALKSDVSAAKQDIQAARQANENVAKQLDDYTKQAQAQGKTIKDIQDAQDGYTATLADVKGNVSKISDAVDGLSASLKDDQDNVATIKAKVDELSATLTDHDKNIAQLTASAKELSSTLEDADGRISKVEQTAQGTQQTVANQQGQINNIKTDAAGIHETLTGQGNQIANINVTLSGLNSKYEGVSGDLGKLKNGAMQNRGTVSAPDFNSLTAAGFYTITHPYRGKNYPTGNWGTLEVSGQTSDSNGRLNQKYVSDNNAETYVRQYNANTKSWTAWIKTANQNDVTALSNRITTNSTQITQNQQAIALKADQATVNNLSGEVSQAQAQLKVQADQISSKVSSEDFKTLDNKVGGAIAQIDKNTTAIDQTNKQISLKADQTEVDQIKNTATQNSSRLDVMAGQISSKVTATDVNNIVDSKGYATTSTVQSLITQKAGTINENITNLDQTVKQDAENNVQLVRKSEFEDGSKGSWNAQMIVSATNPAPPAELGQSGMKVLQSNTCDAYEVDVWYSVKPGEKFDVDFWCAPSTVYNSGFGLVFVDKNKGNSNWLGITTDHSGVWKHYTGTIAAPTNAAFARPWFQIDKDNSDTSNTAWLAKPSIRRQNATTVAAIQQLTASIDGIQSTVANKADKSQITQLSNLVQSKVSTNDFTSKVSQLSTDINARVTKGDLLSQINIAADNTLIQSGKIYLDAKSVVFGQDSQAFIPAALITNLTADQITTGTLKSVQIDNGDGKFTVNPNGDVVANSIKLRNGQFLQGTIAGSTIYALNNDGAQDPKLAPKSDWYKITPNAICWFNHYDQSVGQIGVGQGVLVEGPSEFNGTPGLTISDSTKILLGTAQRTVVTGDEIGNLETTGLDWMSKTNLEIKADGLQVNLDPDQGNEYDGKGARFSIQKNNKAGFYVGIGDSGNEIQFASERIRLRGSYFDDGFNDTRTHTFGNIQVHNLHVMNWLGVDKNKNAIVKTSQGSVAINAYETAEYYFGDIGEGQTNNDGIAYIGIEKLFNETVNTTIPYHVFITAYGPGNIWVDQREHNRFVVKSDQPNLKFSWEIKAKRKGYEHTRLQNVDNKLNHMEATS